MQQSGQELGSLILKPRVLAALESQQPTRIKYYVRLLLLSRR